MEEKVWWKNKSKKEKIEYCFVMKEERKEEQETTRVGCIT